MRISDWSSDVCSSDLELEGQAEGSPKARSAQEGKEGRSSARTCLSQRDAPLFRRRRRPPDARGGFPSDRCHRTSRSHPDHQRERARRQNRHSRSEERSVGKEGSSKLSSWWSPEHYKKT